MPSWAEPPLITFTNLPKDMIIVTKQNEIQNRDEGKLNDQKSSSPILQRNRILPVKWRITYSLQFVLVLMFLVGVISASITVSSVDICTTNRERTHAILERERIAFTSVSGLGGARCRLDASFLPSRVSSELKTDATQHGYILEIHRNRTVSFFNSIERSP